MEVVKKLFQSLQRELLLFFHHFLLAIVLARLEYIYGRQTMASKVHIIPKVACPIPETLDHAHQFFQEVSNTAGALLATSWVARVIPRVREYVLRLPPLTPIFHLITLLLGLILKYFSCKLVGLLAARKAALKVGGDAVADRITRGLLVL